MFIHDKDQRYSIDQTQKTMDVIKTGGNRIVSVMDNVIVSEWSDMSICGMLCHEVALCIFNYRISVLV